MKQQKLFNAYIKPADEITIRNSETTTESIEQESTTVSRNDFEEFKDVTLHPHLSYDLDEYEDEDEEWSGEMTDEDYL